VPNLVDNRSVKLAPAGQKSGSITKQVADVFKVDVECGEWLDNRGTVQSVAAPTFLPAVNNPTAATAISGTKLTITLSAGSDDYTGVMTVVITMSNGEVKETEFDVTVNNS
jgi:hypothetical protein